MFSRPEKRKDLGPTPGPATGVHGAAVAHMAGSEAPHGQVQRKSYATLSTELSADRDIYLYMIFIRIYNQQLSYTRMPYVCIYAI